MNRYSYIFLAVASAAVVACSGNKGAQSAEGNASDSISENVEQVINIVEESAPGIDWTTVMPEIVKNLPKEVVHEHFYNKIGPDSVKLDDDSTKVCPYRDNFYSIYETIGEVHYEFTVLAVPYADSDEVLVIVNSESGVDGMGSLLLKVVNYNLKTKEFNHIGDDIPGVKPSAELLDLSWLSEHPDWVKKLKKNYPESLSYILLGNVVKENGIYVPASKNEGENLVQVGFNDNDICYDIYDEMYSEVPDMFDRLTLNYVWNGKTFELKK